MKGIKKWESILLPGEHIIDKVRGSFEVQGEMGIEYKFGEIFATNERLIWYTRYPFGWENTEIYNYNDIVNVQHLSFTFNSDIVITAKWINYGDIERFLKEICGLI
ncbi:PH domain-containing protein [Shouchella tritolerans]|uniref:PH domain-containing protein n=1 Tax=Shouchella tritolerans TaxID=2979466 RepID=UPI0021E7B312|nr:PH domain-containing protein [Shouchella tritolerans]